MTDTALLLKAALRPWEAFPRLASRQRRLGTVLIRMLLLRTPMAWASGVLGFVVFQRAWFDMIHMRGTAGQWMIRALPSEISVEELQTALAQMPALPPLGSVAAWMVLLAPLWVLSLWLHDAVWDHGSLWLLGSVARTAGFRATLMAEADALSVGSLGALLGLLAYLPSVGWLLALPLALVGIWFWVLRGFALAAWHDCPVWKGVLATVVHALLMACCGAGLMGLSLAVVLLALG